MAQFKKGTLIVFKRPFGHDAEQYEDIMRAFAEIFGKFGIIISDIYHDEEDAIEVVDIWFPTGIVFYAIATANIKPL